MSEHVMVDLETLGVGNNAVILSIGAVKFDPLGPPAHTVDSDKFYIAVDPESCQQHGLTIDAGTVMWWLDAERADPRARLLADTKHDLPTALEGFAMWLGPNMKLWGNGATFDNVILRSAYKAVGLDCPWQFFNDRCYRTVKSICPGVKLERYGVYHNALDDAVSQAAHLQQIARAIGGTW